MNTFKKLTSICFIAMSLLMVGCTDSSIFQSKLGKTFSENFSKRKMKSGNVDFKKLYRCNDKNRPQWPDPCRFWN